MEDDSTQADKEKLWKKEPPTSVGHYWFRYIDQNGVPQEPDIMLLTEPGIAFEFGSEYEWEPVSGCHEYGPKLEPPKV